jgi:hypothetical protein
MITLTVISILLNSIAITIATFTLVHLVHLVHRVKFDTEQNERDMGQDSGSRNSMPAPSIVTDLIRARARVKDTSDIYTLDNAHADIHEYDTGEYLDN